MKLMSWNINGIRSFTQPVRDVLQSLQCDIVCFQETKITRDMLQSDIAIIDGYSSYYSFSQVKQGYSGVSTYCTSNVTPVRAQEGLFHFGEKNASTGMIGCYGNLKEMFTEQRMVELDKEGRTIITQHQYKSSEGNSNLLTVINVYCPRADPEKPERKQFKLDFYAALKERAHAILNSGSDVIICGDLNTSHRRIDHCDPDESEIFYDSPCREWMDRLLYQGGDYSSLKNDDAEQIKEANGSFVDTFRFYHPMRTNAFTCWCTLKGCRQTNYGTRIDYIFANSSFHMKFLVDCDICPEVEGSDHCPVKADISCEVLPSIKCPPCCTKFMSEFGGKQQRLSKFFSKKSKLSGDQNNSEIDSHRIKMSENNHLKRSYCVRESKKRKKQADSDKNIFAAAKQTKLSHYVKKNPTATDLKIEKSINFTDQAIAKRKTVKSEAAMFWKNVLKGPDPSPLCTGHGESSVLRTVKKEGPNLGKKFYCCCRPEGHKNNAEARCSFFQWKT